MNKTEICEQLKVLEPMLAKYIQTRERGLHPARAWCRVRCGYDPTAGERDKENKLAVSNAQRIFKAISNDDPAPEGLQYEYDQCVSFVKDCTHSVTSFLETEKHIRKTMETLAEQLPTWETMKDVRGFGLLSFARIVGCVGDFDNYDSVQKVWKRMGVAVDSRGRAQGYRKKDKTTEEYIEQGYSARRRSVLWTIGDSLLRTNKERYHDCLHWRKRFEYNKAVAAGKCVVSAAKATRESWLDRGMTVDSRAAVGVDSISCGHIHARSKRYCEKLLLMDIWEMWTGTMSNVNQYQPEMHMANKCQYD